MVAAALKRLVKAKGVLAAAKLNEGNMKTKTKAAKAYEGKMYKAVSKAEGINRAAIAALAKSKAAAQKAHASFIGFL